MDFSAKRLALLAGVGDSEDRHEIVREYAQQLNESAETRQLNEDEEAVRKAVRRTIQKMVSEGAITLQEVEHGRITGLICSNAYARQGGAISIVKSHIAIYNSTFKQSKGANERQKVRTSTKSNQKVRTSTQYSQGERPAARAPAQRRVKQSGRLALRTRGKSRCQCHGPCP